MKDNKNIFTALIAGVLVLMILAFVALMLGDNTVDAPVETDRYGYSTASQAEISKESLYDSIDTQISRMRNADEFSMATISTLEQLCYNSAANRYVDINETVVTSENAQYYDTLKDYVENYAVCSEIADAYHAAALPSSDDYIVGNKDAENKVVIYTFYTTYPDGLINSYSDEVAFAIRYINPNLDDDDNYLKALVAAGEQGYLHEMQEQILEYSRAATVTRKDSSDKTFAELFAIASGNNGDLAKFRHDMLSNQVITNKIQSDFSSYLGLDGDIPSDTSGGIKIFINGVEQGSANASSDVRILTTRKMLDQLLNPSY